MSPVEIAIIGAGSRGSGYAQYAENNPKLARVTAVAEPRTEQRNALVEKHKIAPSNVFEDWRDIAKAERLADAAVIATQDAMHVDPTRVLADKGYQILLEKPMAPDVDGCRAIAEAIRRNNTIFAVGHVLRYTDYTQTLKELIAAGRIGELVGIQQLEPVGYWHQAHSFVRGNWANKNASSSMLLAKCCHDVDWIHYIMDSKCTAVSSFGSLRHFTPANRPPNSAERCLDCAVEPDCPYSARRIYGRFLEKGLHGWPLDILASEVNPKNIETALREGPYGRCVYACDNDVVDHQVVNMEFENGNTATLTMMAFTKAAARKTRIFGTKGEITGDGSILRVFDFLTEETEEIDTRASAASVAGGHGGGDTGLMKAFIEAVAENDQSKVLGDCRETLDSHLIVFAAERARCEHRVIELD